jgi:hypothetical protein
MDFSKDFSLKNHNSHIYTYFYFYFLQYYLFLIANIRKMPNITFARFTPVVLLILSITGSSKIETTNPVSDLFPHPT